MAPSVYPEAFGLVVAEAQLRGIPVVSTAICGLVEANQVPQTQVPEIPIVFDPRSWTFRQVQGWVKTIVKTIGKTSENYSENYEDLEMF